MTQLANITISRTAWYQPALADRRASDNGGRAGGNKINLSGARPTWSTRPTRTAASNTSWIVVILTTGWFIRVSNTVSIGIAFWPSAVGLTPAVSIGHALLLITSAIRIG